MESMGVFKKFDLAPIVRPIIGLIEIIIYSMYFYFN